MDDWEKGELVELYSEFLAAGYYANAKPTWQERLAQECPAEDYQRLLDLIEGVDSC